MLVDGEEYEIYLVNTDFSKEKLYLELGDMRAIMHILNMKDSFNDSTKLELQAHFNGGMLVWSLVDEIWEWR